MLDPAEGVLIACAGGVIVNVAASIAAGRRKHNEARQRRPRPRRDDKMITASNGLMIAAMAEAARLLKKVDGDGLSPEDMIREALKAAAQ